MDVNISAILEAIQKARNCSAKEAAYFAAKQAGITCFWCGQIKVRVGKCAACNRGTPTMTDIFSSVHLRADAEDGPHQRET